jgi:hypothetical protein
MEPTLDPAACLPAGNDSQLHTLQATRQKVVKRKNILTDFSIFILTRYMGAGSPPFWVFRVNLVWILAKSQCRCGYWPMDGFWVNKKWKMAKISLDFYL